MVSARVIGTAAATTAAAVAGALIAIHGSSPNGPVARVAPPTPTGVAPSTLATTPDRTAAPPPTAPSTTLKPKPQHALQKPPRTRQKPRALHQYVAATAPYAFRYRGPGFTVWAHVCGMNYARPLDPPGEQHHTVCWVQHGWGYAPGSKGRGTTYVLGHAWAEDPLEVLNPVSRRATAQVLRQHRARSLNGIRIHPVTALNGNVITLRTRTGLLRYTVRSAYAVNKMKAGYVSSLVDDHVRNRVVLITCAELHGVDYDYNIIANAFLTASRAFRT